MADPSRWTVADGASRGLRDLHRSDGRPVPVAGRRRLRRRGSGRDRSARTASRGPDGVDGRSGAGAHPARTATPLDARRRGAAHPPHAVGARDRGACRSRGPCVRLRMPADSPARSRRLGRWSPRVSAPRTSPWSRSVESWQKDLGEAVPCCGRCSTSTQTASAPSPRRRLVAGCSCCRSRRPCSTRISTGPTAPSSAGPTRDSRSRSTPGGTTATWRTGSGRSAATAA